ncbi:MAG: DeoR/GlpR transcriptional regulator [Lactobacillus sp.]|uniref:DeoR/GlpR transcriptional regulator n=1 Tax=Bombilactobacillus bombi TaxID=1303590 RepID=A0A417ZI02_9LACO|nr:DeoR/GlpR family DNA-binding transcription regulator [Bombilactobacillus bombi]MCO6543355.1 DeoR/GlpR transcriptional regulator [Lactobacillus sp.]RHW51203.1 DeoR/GlpR transcriptional regulator [Bombilactobacillus bombi]
MKEQRIKSMIRYIKSYGTVSLDELCQEFGVSKNTVRRDINEIAAMGEIKKVYGGVVSQSQEVLPYENRSISLNEQKDAIAQAAAKYIKNNDLLFIDSGTTTSNIPKYINPELKITIITNSLTIINESLDNDNFEIIVIGNRLKRKTKSFVNVDDWSYFDRMNINKAFLAATGISLDKGVTNSDILEYELKKRVVNKASQNFLLVDHSKFGKAALLTYSDISSLDTIITDDGVPDDIKKTLKQKKVTLVSATKQSFN